MGIPEFTAHELNELSTMGRRHDEYARARQLIICCEAGTKVPTEGQISWLWAIKYELKERLG